jgi:hypothetical protein
MTLVVAFQAGGNVGCEADAVGAVFEAAVDSGKIMIYERPSPNDLIIKRRPLKRP